MVRFILARLVLVAWISLFLGSFVAPLPAMAQFNSSSIAGISTNDSPIPASTADIALGDSDSMFSFSGTRPDNLGVKDGTLAACPSSPNCVSSQSPKEDTEHYIEPLPFSGSADQAIATLKSIIESMERTEITQADSRYLYSEFASKLMGFVDDVEFYIDENAGVIHVRSASRLGQSDLGVNRKRVEEIRAKLAEKA